MAVVLEGSTNLLFGLNDKLDIAAPEQMPVIVDSSWDQRQSMVPPPYTGPMKRLVRGLAIGDERVDLLPISEICCHGGKPRKIGLDPHPDWVDWDRVRRGQAVFIKHLGRSYIALTVALIQGFSIARFAEVLIHNGYAQNAETAFERYRETGFAIMDWMMYPLDEVDSKAQLQLQNVRAMHAFARRRSKGLFNESRGEGIALSQYDMAEVQLGFAGITPYIFEHQMNFRLTREEMEDWIHVWRLIGFHLGIEDEFNVCNSLEDMNEIVSEYMSFVPLRFATCRPATFELQRTALEGFGQYTGLGVEIFSAILHDSCSTKDLEVDYLQRPCLPGMKLVGGYLMRSQGNYYVNRIASWNFKHMRYRWANYPVQQKRLMSLLAMISHLNDIILWRVVGTMAKTWEGFVRDDRRSFVFMYLLGMLGSRFTLRTLTNRLLL